MRDYGKVHTSFWTSSNIRELSEDGRALAMYLLTSPHGTIAGVFRLPDGYACEDLQWEASRVREGFAELLSKGFANRCETTKWVWVIKHFEWNPPENPNQKKSAAKVGSQVPAGCAWKQEFMRVCGAFMGLESTEKSNPSETLSEPFLNQEQEQEQDKEAIASVGSADRLPRCDTQSVVNLYHDTLPELPRVRLMTDGRRKAVSAFWRFVLTSKKSDNTPRATNADEAMDWIGGYFTRARDNDFLMGRGGKAAGHEGWQCDFDFLLTEKGKKHVIEKTRESA